MKKILSLVSVLTLVLGVSQQSKAGGTTGYHNGYYWFTYYTGSGSTTYTPGTSGSNFKGTWTSGVTDSLVGTGWYPGSVRTIGYNCGQLSGSWHTAGVYFWAPYPNNECYITDFGSNGGTFKGTVNSDGGTYNIYLGSQGGGPQYKDSRTSSQSIGANHTITMSNHVNKWATLGWHLGTFNNGCTFMCEAFSGPGTVNATDW